MVIEHSSVPCIIIIFFNLSTWFPSPVSLGSSSQGSELLSLSHIGTESNAHVMVRIEGPGYIGLVFDQHFGR